MQEINKVRIKNTRLDERLGRVRTVLHAELLFLCAFVVFGECHSPVVAMNDDIVAPT